MDWIQGETTTVPPKGGGATIPALIPPQGGSVIATMHEHRFLIAMTESAALRCCEGCGRSWILTQQGPYLWRKEWQEIKESEEGQ